MLVAAAGSSGFQLTGDGNSMFHSLRLHRGLFVVYAWTLAIGANTAAAQSFNPFAGADSLRYRFDLAKNFYSSDAAEAEDRQRLKRRIEALSAESVVESDATAVARFISTADSILMAGGKHLAYFTLRTNLDVTDQVASRQIAGLQSEMSEAFRRLSSVVRRVPESLWEAPELRRWKYLANQLRARAAAAPASPAVSAAVAALTQWEAPTINWLIRETPSPIIETPEGKRDARIEYTALSIHPDRRIRRAAFEGNRRALLSHRETHARLLISTLQSRDAAARLQGDSGFREQSYGQRFLSRTIVRGIFEALAKTADVNKAYENARRARVSHEWGIDTVHTWDIALPEKGMEAPRFTITEASKVFLAAVAPMGDQYVREAAALLDPANGRLDLFPREGRVQRQGFSTGSVGYPSVFFQGRYGGYTDDLIILLHEGGHSIQNMLMTANHVPSMYSGGPGYFTESFAGFNELLVTDYLYRTARDRAHKIYYLERFLDQSTEIYKGARESMLEDALYDSVAAGRVASADDVERMTQSVGSRFSVWFHPGGERVMEWVNASMAVTLPLYRVNYVIAKLLALNYFAQFERDSSVFLPGYRRLLAAGYFDTPEALLAAVGGLAITGDGLVPKAVELIRERLEELTQLYAATPNQPPTRVSDRFAPLGAQACCAARSSHPASLRPATPGLMLLSCSEANVRQVSETRAMSPRHRSASARAASGCIPRATRSSTRSSIWRRSSS